MTQDYATDFGRGMDDLHGFSFYRKPIQNIEPCRAITVVDVYRYLVGHYAKPQTDTLRSLTSPSEAKKYKATHFDYCTFSGLFRKRNEKELIQHSGLLCLDFDHVGNPDRFKERLLKHDYFDTELMFTSPSGDGVKWIIPIDLKGWEHSRYFKAVANCIESTGLPPVDKSGATLHVPASCPTTHRHTLTLNTRNMSKKIFSAPYWENAPSKQEASLPALQTHDTPETTTDLATDIDRVVQEIEANGVDIAPDYGMWVNVGFAIANGLGEQGRDFFHRVSRLHPDYDSANTDKQFTHCLNGRGSGVTIASFFHYAAQAGIELHHSFKTILPNYQNGKAAKWVKSESELPHFPEEIFGALPPFLRKVVDNAISIEDRDVILLGAIGCLSVCFYNVCGVYDERVVYSNHYLFVVAEAGMGKGALTLCRELVAPFNQRLHEQTAQRMIEYKRELSEYQKCKGKSLEAIEPVAPQQKTLIIPANSSASSLISILHDNDGIGLLFETEGDTLSQTLKSEHGNYSDLLRKAFHHETISMSRRKDREYLEIDNPRVSVVLAGTPEQIRHLIPDAENGLLSRFIFYFIPFRRGIRDVFATDDVTRSKHAVFKIMGDELLHLLDIFMNQGSFVFALPTHLQHRFVEWLARLNDECCDEVDNGMQGIVRRLGLIAFRIMMLFPAIRAFDSSLPPTRTPDGRIILVCSEEDFNTVLCICEILLYHSIHIYLKLRLTNNRNVLPDIETGVNARRYALYHNLPNEFDKSVYDRIVSEMNENPNTAAKWIDRFIQDGRLKRTSKGNYVKS